MAIFNRKTSTGRLQVLETVSAFTGVADQVVSTDANGYLNAFVDFTAIGSKDIIASSGVNFTAGDLVAIDGSGEVILADNGAYATRAVGFVNEALLGDGVSTIRVFTFGEISAGITATVGNTYFLGAAGSITATPPTLPGDVGSICQFLGTSLETNNLVFEYNEPYELAVQ